MKYMVPVDASSFAEEAFKTALLSIKPEDELYIISIGEISQMHHPLYTPYVLQSIQQAAESGTKKILAHFARRAKDAGVKFHLLMGTAYNVGETICRAAKERNIDCIIIGRRGLNPVKRFFMGSTSKYCVEHASCNVLVVKGSAMEEEEHSSTAEVKRMEEVERNRRLANQSLQEEHTDVKAVVEQEEAERARRMNEMKAVSTPPALKGLNRNITIMAEEEERRRRIDEEVRMMTKEEADREAAKIGVIIDEEQERKRRMDEEYVNCLFHREAWKVERVRAFATAGEMWQRSHQREKCADQSE